VLNRTRVVVFEAPAPVTVRAVAATESDPAVTYDKPRLLRSSGRVLLHIPGSESGTGNFNRERLFVWRDGQWGDGQHDRLARRAGAPPPQRVRRLEGDLSRLRQDESLDTVVA
jgi:hypothetical protein